MAACLLSSPPAQAVGIMMPPGARARLPLLYSGSPDAAIPLFRKLQAANPNDPLGFLLEGEAMWWKIYCTALETRYGFIGAWRRPKQADDAAYFALADKTIALA